MRAAKPHRHAKTLGRADHNIRPHLARRGEQRQRQQVGADHGQPAGRMGRGDLGREIADSPAAPGIIQHNGERFGGGDRGGIAGRHIDNLPAQRPGAGGDHARGSADAHPLATAMYALSAVCNACAMATASAAAVASSSSEALAISMPVKLADHGLEIQDRLQPPLRDLRLIRRIGRIPAGIFQHIALDHRRGDGAVIAQPDQRILHHDFGRPEPRRSANTAASSKQRAAAPNRRWCGWLSGTVWRSDHPGWPPSLSCSIAAISCRIGADMAGDKSISPSSAASSFKRAHATASPENAS